MENGDIKVEERERELNDIGDSGVYTSWEGVIFVCLKGNYVIEEDSW